MVQTQTIYLCEVCRTPYSRMALAQKCERSDAPQIPIWPAKGDQVKLMNYDEMTYTQAVFKTWILAPIEKIFSLNDEELLSLPNDFEFHEWHLELASPVVLNPDWEQGRITIPSTKALTPHQAKSLARREWSPKKIKTEERFYAK